MKDSSGGVPLLARVTGAACSFDQFGHAWPAPSIAGQLGVHCSGAEVTTSVSICDELISVRQGQRLTCSWCSRQRVVVRCPWEYVSRVELKVRNAVDDTKDVLKRAAKER